ncbi:MAG: hypothetical protein HY226_04050 [Candidatus Vogelbacteria bacterium]|nr:hypothetical protein [Candidatus Vogelbacteria bacterium]
MFEGWFGKKKKEEQTEDPLAFKKEGWEAFNELSPKWQEKVMNLLQPARAKYFNADQKLHEPEYYQIMEDVVYTAAILEKQERDARSRIKKIADEIVRQTRRNIIPIGLSIILAGGLSIRSDLIEAEGRVFLTDAEAKQYRKIDDKAFAWDKLRIAKTGKTAAEMPVIKVESRLTPIEVLGFEKFDIPGAVIKKIVEETLPSSISFNVRKITYVDRSIPMPESYGKKVTRVRAAHFDGAEGELLVSRGAKGFPEWWFVNSIIIHELGHASDWHENGSLSIEEKLQLLQEISTRVKSPDRYISSYVEAIENEDKSLEWKEKTIEYFAEIVCAYLSDEYVKLPGADRKIVWDLIKKFDPKFDREAALVKRRAIVNRLMESYFVEK